MQTSYPGPRHNQRVTTDAEILEQQRALQREADSAVAELGLDKALAVFGDAVRTGSSALGLMVRPDIDITVCCEALDAGTVGDVIDLGARLARQEQVRRVLYRDDTGSWNTEPVRYPDGVYLGLGFRSEVTGREWTADIWFVDEPERQPDLAHLRTLPPRLTDAARVTILRIKHARSASGATIYEAVLDAGVTSPVEFDSWLAAAGSR